MGPARGSTWTRKVIGAWLFLAAVSLVYSVSALINPAVAGQALASFGSVLVRIIPALGLVYGLIFLAELYLDRASLARHLGETSGLSGWALAIGSGILSVGPLYAWYPLLGELKARGMRDALIAAFLYARALKLPLLPIMVHAFGLAFTVTLSLCIVVFSVVSGLLVSAIPGTGDAGAVGTRRGCRGPAQPGHEIGVQRR